MKRWQAITLTIICTLLGCVGMWCLERNAGEQNERRAASQRQIIYQSTLQSYKSVLANGTTREQVEDLLRKRGMEVSKICCLDQSKSYAEITKIGYELGPWYCDGYEVYIGFQFSGPLASEDLHDTLKEISVVSLPDDCL
jgi:hypothetical protein